MIRFSILAAATLALTACGSDPEPVATEENETGGARGEVLGGSISDDMLPLDTLTSRSPPLRGAGSGGTEATDEGSTSSANESDADAPEPPAAEPVAEENEVEEAAPAEETEAAE